MAKAVINVPLKWHVGYSVASALWFVLVVVLVARVLTVLAIVLGVLGLAGWLISKFYSKTPSANNIEHSSVTPTAQERAAMRHVDNERELRRRELGDAGFEGYEQWKSK